MRCLICPPWCAGHLLAALAVWDYCEASARFIFGDALGDPVADEILRALRQAGEEGMTRTAIRENLFQRNMPARRIQRACLFSWRPGWYRWSESPTPADGRRRYSGL